MAYITLKWYAAAAAAKPLQSCPTLGLPKVEYAYMCVSVVLMSHNTRSILSVENKVKMKKTKQISQNKTNK